LTHPILFDQRTILLQSGVQLDESKAVVGARRHVVTRSATADEIRVDARRETWRASRWSHRAKKMDR
jgi:hypothetical protein